MSNAVRVSRGGRPRSGPAASDHAPRVEMGGKSVVILGGNVSTIPAHPDDDRDEVDYEKGPLPSTR
ncbi:hypothetical protein [Actinophytocola oryzae]|uniref:Uncharacterized protein n=1 Tax=Actinophytocola oryzae TaxID=502181 RepID=A0A4R7VXX3_9PSEU|nr:hypothetical protein [Actinophytocola oryzae]TDV54842.1 hypothetical protein CLV71_10382 [Actinophytocola oryzae]